MRTDLLMNCLWFEDLAPDELADALELTTEALFEKIFGKSGFSNAEIRQIMMLLGLTEKEAERIFFA